ncbi:MAG: asparagine synthase (glutamine-hydrolyzing) [Gemmatimonadota bacterium]
MCGIVGVLHNGSDLSAACLESQLMSMAGTLRHRGPDGAGQWSDPPLGIGLGHRRLAIIDLSDRGAQPMHSANKRFVITFNGEIYNYPELRDELRARGHQFRGTSDTEVMLAAFEEWGVTDAVKRFCGMFAFALWDRMSRQLTLARDRLGEKPLYYGWLGQTLVFGSELKPLTRHPAWLGEIDRNVLALYCQAKYVPGPYSIYRGVRKLAPGTTVKFDRDRLATGKLPTPVPYWSLRNAMETAPNAPFVGSEQEAADCLEQILGTVVKGQMLADVPLGALLSGGIDSSTIVAMMQKYSTRPVKTFTVGFEETAYDESHAARAVAAHLGTVHSEFQVRAADALALIPDLSNWYDEPFADPSQIPTALVMRLARKHVTVCLTGDGGDEVFCGYNRHVQLQRIWQHLGWLPLRVRRLAAAASRQMPVRWYEWLLRRQRWGILGDQIQKLAVVLESSDLEAAYIALASIWSDPVALVPGSKELPWLLTDRSAWPNSGDQIERLMYVEAMTSLPDDMLVKVDRAAMAVSLETRVPLLDHRVVEYASSLPLDFKLRGGKGKRLLRRVLTNYVPPTLVERPKQGFGIPLDVWLRGPLRDWAESLLDVSKLRAHAWFDPTLVRKCWDEHLSGRRKTQWQLWTILMFQAWHDGQRSTTDSLV